MYIFQVRSRRSKDCAPHHHIYFQKTESCSMIFFSFYMTGYKTYKKKWMVVTCKDNLDHSGETQKGISKAIQRCCTSHRNIHSEHYNLNPLFSERKKSIFMVTKNQTIWINLKILHIFCYHLHKLFTHLINHTLLWKVEISFWIMQYTSVFWECLSKFIHL